MKSERIKAQRKLRKLTQQQLGDLIGVSKATISQWEKGDYAPGGDNLVLLAKALNVPVQWIVDGKGDPHNSPPSNVEPGPDTKGKHPLISWESAVLWPKISENELKTAAYYPCLVDCSEHTFVLKMQGSSMEPVFETGDLLFVDPQPKHRHESFVIVQLEGDTQATFRQLIVESDKHKYLQSCNPNWPEKIIPMTGNSRIIGTVVFVGKAF